MQTQLTVIGTVPPEDLCKTVTVRVNYLSFYQADAEQPLASASFFPRAPNLNSVVYHSGGVVGQITSDGNEVTWEGELDAPIILCIEQNLDGVYAKYTLQVLAYLYVVITLR